MSKQEWAEGDALVFNPVYGGGRGSEVHFVHRFVRPGDGAATVGAPVTRCGLVAYSAERNPQDAAAMAHCARCAAVS